MWYSSDADKPFYANLQGIDPFLHQKWLFDRNWLIKSMSDLYITPPTQYLYKEAPCVCPKIY